MPIRFHRPTRILIFSTASVFRRWRSRGTVVVVVIYSGTSVTSSSLTLLHPEVMPILWFDKRRQFFVSTASVYRRWRSRDSVAIIVCSWSTNSSSLTLATWWTILSSTVQLHRTLPWAAVSTIPRQHVVDYCCVTGLPDWWLPSLPRATFSFSSLGFSYVNY